ncbi:hypothetical protein [Actinomadura gamaensis]|uniref:Uncharacterized protein n=1 Tax=Actinomadura gamaensis TaxID=1763541 RepID=A0ABV9U452_9ACTN
MGVLTDYFRAPDDEAVIRLLDRTRGHSPIVGRKPSFDGVEAKGVDPGVVLGSLVATIRGVPWDVQQVKVSQVWPPASEQEPDPSEDDPFQDGPWAFALDDPTRDTLAGVAPADVTALVVTFVERTEELRGGGADEWRPVVEDLIGLARTARDADQHLYCWACL